MVGRTFVHYHYGSGCLLANVVPLWQFKDQITCCVKLFIAVAVFTQNAGCFVYYPRNVSSGKKVHSKYDILYIDNNNTVFAHTINEPYILGMCGP